MTQSNHPAIVITDYRDRILTDLSLESSQSDTYLLMLLKGIGDYNKGIETLTQLAGRCTLIFHGSKCHTDAMIAASLGVNSGIELMPDSQLDESLSELAAYHFYTRVPHGGIEPFYSLQQAYSPSRRLSPQVMYGRFPTPEEWQQHLIKPDPCAVCPAFRICSGYFSKQSDKEDCRRLMTDVLEGIEYSKGGGD